MATELRHIRAAAPKQGAAAAGRGRFALPGRLGPRGVGLDERMLFTERLALLLDTGVSLVEALRAMKGQSEDARPRAILDSLSNALHEGKPFSAALALHPEMFPATYVSLVAAAEEGGFLVAVLQELYGMDEKRRRVRSTLVSALSYPVFLVVFSVVVVVFILVAVFPRFRDLFETIRNDLPLPTRVLLLVSDFLTQHWLLAGLAAIAAAWSLAAWSRTPAGALALDRLKMRVPVVKDIFVQIYLAEILGVLGLSLAHGVPIIVALKACGEIMASGVFAGFLDGIKRQVNEGEGVAAAFNASEWVPPMVRQMISTAEQAGNLGPAMTKVGDFYARELERRIAVFSKAIEPVMLLVMGAVVGVIVAALVLPIFKLSRAVR